MFRSIVIEEGSTTSKVTLAGAPPAVAVIVGVEARSPAVKVMGFPVVALRKPLPLMDQDTEPADVGVSVSVTGSATPTFVLVLGVGTVANVSVAIFIAVAGPESEMVTGPSTHVRFST
jgi:hypothetical protein